MAGTVFGLPDHVAVVAVVAVVSVVAGLRVVSAQSAAAPLLAPSDGALPAAEAAQGCFRPLLGVIWDFLVTLLACSVTFWGRYKHSLLGKRVKIRAAFYAVFLPLCGLHEYIWASYENAMLIWKYQQLKQTLQCRHQFLDQFRELWTSCLSPSSKFPGRILFWCDVVVYVEKQSSLLEVDWLWVDNRFVKVESEAMVIGEVAVGKTKDGDYERKELSSVGCLVLMLADAFPDYDELKFLRGYSGFAVIAIAIQALAYISAVLSREAKHLPVAPLEVVGLILNIILVIEVSVYSFFNPCHRPLVIYTNINSKREKQLLETLAALTEPKVPLDRFAKVFSFVATAVDLGLCAIVVYFIITLIQASNIFVVLPLIFFVIVTIILIIDFVIFVNFEYGVTWKLTIHWFTIPFSIIVYTWALVVTMIYWKPQHFDAQAKLFNISQLIPFIG